MEEEKQTKYFDSHCHLQLKQFDKDRSEVLVRMQEKNISACVVGVDLETSKQAVELAEKNNGIYACIGLHPIDGMKEEFNPSDYSELVKSEKVVAIGECGLEYFRGAADTENEKARQRREFEAQIDFAVKNDKLLMMHIRSSQGTTDAHDDALKILKKKKEEYGEKLRIHSHFFTMSWDIAEQFLALGSTFAFPGVITFAKETQIAVKALPLESIIAETDAPYAAPVPHRGKRNEPVFVIDIVQAIAEIRGEDFEKVREQLVKNALRVFNIK